MSGRLIILPKKSWHPGKRENIEKVLRDERLAAEEAAAARERAREITQEGIVETLTKKRSASETIEGGANAASGTPTSRRRRGRGQDRDEEALGGKGQGWGATLQHVNLFSDAEREAGKILGQNSDHQREKKEQELQKQQRSGLAPTALGDGSAELKDKDSQPWYTNLQPQSTACVSKVAARTVRLGREVTGQEAEEAIKRDQRRKGRADPMGSLFRSGAQTTRGSLPFERRGTYYQPEAATANPPGAAGLCVDEATLHSDRGEHAGKAKKVKKAMKVKKDKKGKKDKKKSAKEKSHSKETQTRSDRDRLARRHGDSAAGLSGGRADEATDAQREQKLKDLRSRRLAREGGERERQIRLLAEREMAGHSLPDERTRAYNNQYNAPAARQNRIR
ncbi:unnamed protein product [Ectocarpus sp. CCAP 1310/34]|nr:unnamed protein product [Ectocarpus sp. CCAP 1310/34]